MGVSCIQSDMNTHPHRKRIFAKTLIPPGDSLILKTQEKFGRMVTSIQGIIKEFIMVIVSSPKKHSTETSIHCNKILELEMQVLIKKDTQFYNSQ